MQKATQSTHCLLLFSQKKRATAFFLPQANFSCKLIVHPPPLQNLIPCRLVPSDRCAFSSIYGLKRKIGPLLPEMNSTKKSELCEDMPNDSERFRKKKPPKEMQTTHLYWRLCELSFVNRNRVSGAISRETATNRVPFHRKHVKARKCSTHCFWSEPKFGTPTTLKNNFHAQMVRDGSGRIITYSDCKHITLQQCKKIKSSGHGEKKTN